MNMISQGYYKAASGLVQWAIADLLAYFVECILLAHSFFLDFLNIVQYYPYFAGVKILIAGLILLVAAVRVKRNRKVRSITAITWMVAVAVFFSWGMGMYCATSLMAESEAASYSNSYISRASIFTGTAANAGDFELGDFCNNYTVWKVAYRSGGNKLNNRPTYCPEGSGFIGHLSATQVFPVTAVFDSAGNVVTGTWEDAFFLRYQTEEQWKSGEDVDPVELRVAFDREKLTEDGKAKVFSDSSFVFIHTVRFTGYFKNGEFVLQKVEYIPDSYDLNVHNKYDIPWRLGYEDADVTIPDGEAVTLYASGYNVEACYRVETPGFTYNGEKYDDVADYVRKVGPQALSGYIGNSVHEAGGQLLTSVEYCVSRQGEKQFSRYFHSPDIIGEDAELEYYVVSAVYCRPWIAAMGQLIYVYIATFALALGLVMLIHRTIKRHLILPLWETCEALNRVDGQLAYELESSDEWYEGKRLSDGWKKTRKEVMEQRNELKRLNTALEYAKTAEENRRQMTSNIAHELKTPLAIIHSYAEGLKEHIAEEKRDKYIDVILSETQRTDAMVLQMLDLSRLEAGKVKLAQNSFSLIDMTKAVFERLELAAGAKELKVEFDFPESLEIVADESRMAQVVENLATNAVKYTPAGGHIRVEGYGGRKGTVFSIENDSSPLSQEALDKVWEVFYRADEARSGGGTGLGLAITKTIVELHGGKCSVQNTKTGVKFGFTI